MTISVVLLVKANMICCFSHACIYIYWFLGYIDQDKRTKMHLGVSWMMALVFRWTKITGASKSTDGMDLQAWCFHLELSHRKIWKENDHKSGFKTFDSNVDVQSWHHHGWTSPLLHLNWTTVFWLPRLLPYLLLSESKSKTSIFCMNKNFFFLNWKLILWMEKTLVWSYPIWKWNNLYVWIVVFEIYITLKN